MRQLCGASLRKVNSAHPRAAQPHCKGMTRSGASNRNGWHYMDRDRFEPLGKSNLSKPAPAGSPSPSSSPSPRAKYKDMATTKPDFENTAGFRLAEKILDRSKLLDPELTAAPPRKIELRKALTHKHLEPKTVILIAVLGLAILSYLCFSTYNTYHELPLFAVLFIVAGLALLTFALLSHAPADCDCHWQKELIRAGSVVTGQITEKRVSKDGGAVDLYEVEYAFQPEGDEESHWTWVKVGESEYDSIDEGDDVTVVYASKKGNYVSRIYRFCVYRAIAS